MPSLGSSSWLAFEPRRGSATCRSRSATKPSVAARKAKRQRRSRSR